MRASYTVYIPTLCGFEWTPWGWEMVFGDVVFGVIYDADRLREILMEMDKEMLKMMLMMVFEFEEWYRMARDKCDNLGCIIDLKLSRYRFRRGLLRMAGVKFKEISFELCPGKERRIDAYRVDPVEVVYDVTAMRKIHIGWPF